jgi:hypothetical protein
MVGRPHRRSDVTDHHAHRWEDFDMLCQVDWWCPKCGEAPSFRGMRRLQFGHGNACRCQWLMFGSAEIGPTSAAEPDYLETFILGYRFVTRRRDEIRPPMERPELDRTPGEVKTQSSNGGPKWPVGSTTSRQGDRLNVSRQVNTHTARSSRHGTEWHSVLRATPFVPILDGFRQKQASSPFGVSQYRDWTGGPSVTTLFDGRASPDARCFV